MNNAIPDCMVTGYEDCAAALDLPEAKDRHVLAAAIVGDRDTIITLNIKHFPAETLSPPGIVARRPDDMLHDPISSEGDNVCSALRRVRERLKHPSMSPDQYLENLKSVGLVNSAELLVELSHSI